MALMSAYRHLSAEEADYLAPGAEHGEAKRYDVGIRQQAQSFVEDAQYARTFPFAGGELAFEHLRGIISHFLLQ